MTDNISEGVARMAGVAVMGAVAMKTIDIMDGRSKPRRGKKKKRSLL